jgi:chromosome segregation ATPase
MFPEAAKIIEISNLIINSWHEFEHQIFSFADALKLITNSNNSDIYYHIELLALINTSLWHEEDKARDISSTDTDIANVKRKIDRLNQTRVNKAEEIDNLLLMNIRTDSSAPLSTESAGSIIDRMTILALKRYHMEYETNRENSTEKTRKNCAEKLERINRQIKDLVSAYDFFTEEINSGKKRYAVYRQFKMYNDPELNPVLYNKKKN